MNTITERRPDKLLMLITALLVGFGALMIYSSTSVLTPAMAGRHITTPLYYFKRHMITVIMSVGAAYLAYKIKPELLGRASPVLLVASLVLLGLVFTHLGISAGGARRWIRLWPSTFQPSEFVKLSMVIALAWYLSRDFFDTGNFWVSMAGPVAVMGVFQAVFLKQPDFGGAITLGVITLGMLFLAGVRMRYLSVLLVGLVPVLYKLIQEPYRLRRVTSFLDPWNDAQGSGFQLVQSFIAIGRGGLTGVGLGKSMQKLAFLPEMHTDFIFSIIGEELGFVAAALVVLLFCAFFIRGAQVASRMERDRFRYFLAYGLSMMVAFQGLVNFGVVTGLLPTKGLPLPFISYGGSSLLVSMAAVGILLGISRGEAPVEKKDRLKEALDRKKARRTVYGGAR